MTITIERRTVTIAELVRDDSLRARVTINEQHVVAIAATLAEEGGKIEHPIDVHEIDGRLYLANGFHRTLAAEHAGHTTIDARIVKNSSLIAAVRDAVRFDKFSHMVLKRTNADKRRAVQLLLDAGAYPGMTQNEIAIAAGVSQFTVSAQIAERRQSPIIESISGDSADAPPPLVWRGTGEKRRLVYDTLNPWLIRMRQRGLQPGEIAQRLGLSGERDLHRLRCKIRVLVPEQVGRQGDTRTPAERAVGGTRRTRQTQQRRTRVGGSTAADVQQRSYAALDAAAQAYRPLTREQVDPNFQGNDSQFAWEYGHTPMETRDQREHTREQQRLQDRLAKGVMDWSQPDPTREAWAFWLSRGGPARKERARGYAARWKAVYEILDLLLNDSTTH